MKSVEIYKILNNCLKDELKVLGFKKVKFTRFGWFKNIGDINIIYIFQCNSWGWNYYTGHSFTLFEGFYTKNLEFTIPVKPYFKLKNLLAEEDLREWVTIQNSVISKFHRYDVNIYKETHPSGDPAFLDFLEKQFDPINIPLPNEKDIDDMRVYDESDVLRFGEFFNSRIGRIYESMEKMWLESKLRSTRATFRPTNPAGQAYGVGLTTDIKD